MATELVKLQARLAEVMPGFTFVTSRVGNLVPNSRLRLKALRGQLNNRIHGIQGQSD